MGIQNTLANPLNILHTDTCKTKDNDFAWYSCSVSPTLNVNCPSHLTTSTIAIIVIAIVGSLGAGVYKKFFATPAAATLSTIMYECASLRRVMLYFEEVMLYFEEGAICAHAYIYIHYSSYE